MINFSIIYHSHILPSKFLYIFFNIFKKIFTNRDKIETCKKWKSMDKILFNLKQAILLKMSFRVTRVLIFHQFLLHLIQFEKTKSI